MALERKFKIGKPILEVKNISLSFGGVKAITDTSFDVLEHEVRAIIGPNGAGKSSMLNCINGIYKPQKGTVSFKGKQIHNITPNIMAQMGLSRTFQNLALFKRMSVLDNILVGRKLHTKTNFLEVAFQLPKVKKEEKINRERSEEISSNYFNSRPKGSQIGALVSERQSSVIPSKDFLIEKFNSLIKKFENKDIPRPKNWGGFIVNPVEYEFWQGGENRLHDRIRYKLVDNLWKIDRLSP